MAKDRKSKQDPDKIGRKIRQQFSDMFSEGAALPTHMSLREVEALKARVSELEAKLAGQAEAGEGEALSSEKTPQPSSIEPTGGNLATPGTAARPMPGPLPSLSPQEKARVAELEAELVRKQPAADTYTPSTVQKSEPKASVATPASETGKSLPNRSPFLNGFAHLGRVLLSSHPSNKLSFRVRYTLFGALFGFAFPIFSLVVVLLTHTLPATLASVVEAHRLNSLLWVIDSAPFFLGLFAMFIGQREDRLQQTLESLKEAQARRDTSAGLLQQSMRNLALAVEVSRAVSERTANLPTLLSEATELIRERFNLYYTQIYLLDPSRCTLIMRAGTGEVGTQLLNRGHQLPVGSGSLNGRAASERQAVIVSDTTQSTSFLSNPLLPKTRSEMAVPLVTGGQVLGVLDMQSEQPGALNETNLPAFETLAGELAIAIQNAALLGETRQARAEVEDQVRRLTEHGWQEFLDAIERGQKIGFAFDQTNLIALGADALDRAPADALKTPITVTGAQIGAIQLTPASEHNWTAEETEVLRATAAQLGQHLENLRLLAQTERYRNQAEEVARRLTREGWKTLQMRGDVAPGYVYDLNEVKQLSGSGNGTSAAPLKRPLVVHDTTIGELEVELDACPDGADELLAAVAERLSGHIENLRLSEGTQDALIWQQAINRTNNMIGKAKTIEDLVRGAAELLPLLGMLSCSIEVIREVDSEGKPTLGDLHIVRFSDNEFKTMPPLLGQAISDWVPSDPKYYQENRVTVFPDLEDLTTVIPPNAAKPKGSIAYMLKVGMRSAICLALGVHNRSIGYLTFASRTPLTRLPDEYIERLGTIVDLVSTAIDNQLLFGETERGRQTLGRRAAELETVAEVSVTSATLLDPDRLLQTVVDLTKERFGVYHVHIYLVNDTRQSLLLAAGAGDVGRQMVATGHTIPTDADKSLVARAVRERQAIIVNDVRSDPTFLPNPLLPDTRAEMAVPMIVGDKVLGVFDVQSDRPSAFTGEDASIYTTLSAQVAIALQNARLYAEQAATVTQLRELDRLKSSFLANMSHELRTPLNSILGFTDVMLEELDGPLSENMNTDLSLIQKNGQHLLHLINDVLDMAKIEAGKMSLNPERFRVQEIFEEVVSITSPLASEKSLALFVEDDSDQDVEVNADRTRIRQVMINLVNNALKFTEKGKVSLRATSQEKKVLISVRDTGIGIPSDKLDVIFQEFTQVDTTATRKVGGTGLGLPISRRLIEIHGGRLWAESTGISGEGSVFYVELPLQAEIATPIEKMEK